MKYLKKNRNIQGECKVFSKEDGRYYIGSDKNVKDFKKGGDPVNDPQYYGYLCDTYSYDNDSVNFEKLRFLSEIATLLRNLNDKIDNLNAKLCKIDNLPVSSAAQRTENSCISSDNTEEKSEKTICENVY